MLTIHTLHFLCNYFICKAVFLLHYWKQILQKLQMESAGCYIGCYLATY